MEVSFAACTLEERLKLRDRIQRRANVTCALSPAQLAAAVNYITSTAAPGGGGALSPHQELVRCGFTWDGVDNSLFTWRFGLLDAIESSGSLLQSPCMDCFQKTPEARASLRELAAHGEAAHAGGGAKAAGAGKKRPAVTCIACGEVVKKFVKGAPVCPCHTDPTVEKKEKHA
jgi:hypothetical protein